LFVGVLVSVFVGVFATCIVNAINLTGDSTVSSTAPKPVKVAVKRTVRKPERALIRLIDRVTITFDVSKSLLAIAAIITATNAPNVVSAVASSAMVKALRGGTSR
jgi:hypothetical protein